MSSKDKAHYLVSLKQFLTNETTDIHIYISYEIDVIYLDNDCNKLKRKCDVIEY